MLWESSKMEQRCDAVLGVIRDGFSVTEVAQKFGVSRQAVHTWLKRYEEGGLEALGERSHRPSVSPNQMPAVIEARVLELRRHHPSWGQANLLHRPQTVVSLADVTRHGRSVTLLRRRPSNRRSLAGHRQIGPTDDHLAKKATTTALRSRWRSRIGWNPPSRRPLPQWISSTP